MPRFRLKTATMAVEAVDGLKKEGIVLPAGSEVQIDCLPNGIRPNNWMVDVRWDGRPVMMFLIDLLDRGERVDGARK